MATTPLIKPSHRGLLHARLHIPANQTIPLSRIGHDLARAKRAGDTTAVKQDVFAKNFRRR